MVIRGTSTIKGVIEIVNNINKMFKYKLKVLFVIQSMKIYITETRLPQKLKHSCSDGSIRCDIRN